MIDLEFPQEPQEPQTTQPIEFVGLPDQATGIDALAIDLDAIRDTAPVVPATANTAHRVPTGRLVALMAGVAVLLAGCGPSSGEAAPTAPAVAASSPAAPTAPSAAESSAPTSTPEHDPVKGGDWAKLSPEQQADFSRLAAEPWETMDRVTFMNNFGANETLSHEFALYLYRNNVDSTLARVIAGKTNPAQIARIEAARTITTDGNGGDNGSADGESYLLNAALLLTTDYDIGITNPDIGAFLIGQAFDPTSNAYEDGAPGDEGMALYQNYIASGNPQPIKFDGGTAMKPPVIRSNKYAGRDGKGQKYIEYSDVILDNVSGPNSHTAPHYVGDIVPDPVSGQETLLLTRGL